MDNSANFYCLGLGYSTFYACNYGSRFLGCCENNPSPYYDVCVFGCGYDDVCPAEFGLAVYGAMSAVPSNPCPDGYWWEICKKDALSYYFGCSEDDTSFCANNGIDFTNATLPVGLADNSPYPLNEPDVPKVAPVNSISTGRPTIVSVPTTSNVSHSSSSSSALPTHAPIPPPPPPSKPQTGAIAGGSIGGIAFLAALIGFLILYCRRRRASRTATRELSEKPVIEDSTMQTPAPAYTPLSEDQNFKKPVPDMGSPDIPRPISEMAGSEAVGASGRTNAGSLGGTGFIPYSPKRGTALGSHSAQSSVDRFEL